MAASKVAVFLDYQNVHLMAHGLFMQYGTPVQDALVHPLRVAERLVAKRRDDNELVSVREDPRVQVTRRDLNYRGWPDHPPREKGVDVALAIALVESAMLNEYDVVIVFSGDTDLIPAVQITFRRTGLRCCA